MTRTMTHATTKSRTRVAEMPGPTPAQIRATRIGLGLALLASLLATAVRVHAQPVDASTKVATTLTVDR